MGMKCLLDAFVSDPTNLDVSTCFSNSDLNDQKARETRQLVLGILLAIIG